MNYKINRTDSLFLADNCVPVVHTCRASASLVPPFEDGLSSEVITTRSLAKLSSIPPSTSTVRFRISTAAPATVLRLAEV